MALFAVIKDGVVTNVIIADTKEIAEQVTKQICVEFEDTLNAPSIGFTYDGKKFTQPTPTIFETETNEPTE
jgi:hypothetical protein